MVSSQVVSIADAGMEMADNRLKGTEPSHVPSFDRQLRASWWSFFCRNRHLFRWLRHPSIISFHIRPTILTFISRPSLIGLISKSSVLSTAS